MVQCLKDFRKTIKFKKIKNCHFSFFDILQLPQTVISNSEKLTYPNIHYTVIKPISLSDKGTEV